MHYHDSWTLPYSVLSPYLGSGLRNKVQTWLSLATSALLRRYWGVYRDISFLQCVLGLPWGRLLVGLSETTHQKGHIPTQCPNQLSCFFSVWKRSDCSLSSLRMIRLLTTCLRESPHALQGNSLQSLCVLCFSFLFGDDPQTYKPEATKVDCLANLVK